MAQNTEGQERKAQSHFVECTESKFLTVYKQARPTKHNQKTWGFSSWRGRWGYGTGGKALCTPTLAYLNFCPFDLFLPSSQLYNDTLKWSFIAFAWTSCSFFQGSCSWATFSSKIWLLTLFISLPWIVTLSHITSVTFSYSALCPFYI